MATVIPNQPLSAHSIPLSGRKILGAGSLIAKSVALADGDVLLIAPPAVDPNGVVAREISTLSQVGIRATVAIAAAPNDVKLVYKAEGGREVILASSGVLALGATKALDIPAAFLLAPTDLGIFIRVAGAGLAVVDVYTQFVDVRGPVRTSLDVTAVEAVAVGANGNAALAQTLLTASDVGSALLSPHDPDALDMLSVANFDTVDHTFHVFLTDGTDTIELDNTAVPVPVVAGTMVTLPFSGFAPTLLEGWSLKVSIDEAVTTTAPRVIAGYQPTNLEPVRSNQGGAF